MGNNMGCCDTPLDDSDFKNFCLSHTSHSVNDYLKSAIQKEALNNVVIEGEWGDSIIKTGKGVIFNPHLFCYQGDVIDSNADGEGIILWPNKAVYSGQVKSNKAHGIGQLKFYQSSSIKGQWIEGELAQNSQIQYLNRGQKFVFEIVKKLQNSKNSKNPSIRVKIFIDGGSIYEGQINKKGDCEFIIQGHGKMAFADGSFYQGSFLQGKMHGKGKYVWAKSGHWYEGSYFNNFRDGRGTYYQSETKFYNGIWKVGKYQVGEL